MMDYYIYLLRCRDGSLYCGITTDPERRLKEHSGGRKGAKYTASHPPLGFARIWRCHSRSEALKLEYRLKQLSKAEKEGLAAGKSLPNTESDDYVPIL